MSQLEHAMLRAPLEALTQVTYTLLGDVAFEVKIERSTLITCVVSLLC
jgi:hypothetical protein